jgi:tRNA-dihydrouridine synthase C
MQLALAPMEGLIDETLRTLLTEVGGIDWCVSEFVRINHTLLPAHCFLKLAPELQRGSRTPSGTPMRVQLLGSDPACVADNAAFAATLGAPVIDLNFGCPAKTVNKSRGGAVLLKEPELLHAIVSAVRRALPADIPVTAKMRLGFDHADDAETCAQALADGGAASIVVHARTKVDGYKPPAYWERIGGIRDAVKVPVFANGEVWSVEDWQRCRSLSGVDDVMLGRGMIARPDLARQIAAIRDGREVTPMGWAEMQPILARYWDIVCAGVATPRYAPGLLKQWLVWLARSYPEAAALFVAVRALTSIEAISAMLAASAPAVELGR